MRLPATCRFAACALLALAGPGFASAGAASDSSAAPPAQRVLAFMPGPLDRCRFFLVTEVSATRLALDRPNAMDGWMYGDHLGLMHNVSPRWAVGVSYDLLLATGDFSGAPTVRCRRWLPHGQSLELAIGLPGGGGEGVVGPLATLRYAPAPPVFVQGVGATLRSKDWFYDPVTPTWGVRNHDTPVGGGGFGFAGPPGAVVMIAEAAAFGFVIALLLSSVE